MANQDARVKAGLKTAEDELNLIKNQVQQTLLDIREHILDASNPFNAIDAALTDEDEIEFGSDLMGAAGAAGADGADGDSGDDLDDDELLASLAGDDDEDEEGDLDEELPGIEDIDDEGEEIIEELPDDDYVDDQIIDDGGSGAPLSSGLSDPEEVFEEEEEIPVDEDEGFELDEEVDPEAAENVAVDATGAPINAITADFDVLTMAGLVRWVAVTTERLGSNRTEIMLDAFESAGRIAPSTRMVLHHLMALTEEEPGKPIPVREIVSSMVRMEGVLDTGAGTESTRLLSMLMDIEDDPLDRLAA